jgi:hypothetical protein
VEWAMLIEDSGRNYVLIAAGNILQVHEGFTDFASSVTCSVCVIATSTEQSAADLFTAELLSMRQVFSVDEMGLC